MAKRSDFDRASAHATLRRVGRSSFATPLLVALLLLTLARAAVAQDVPPEENPYEEGICSEEPEEPECPELSEHVWVDADVVGQKARLIGPVYCDNEEVIYRQRIFGYYIATEECPDYCRVDGRCICPYFHSSPDIEQSSEFLNSLSGISTEIDSSVTSAISLARLNTTDRVFYSATEAHHDRCEGNGYGRITFQDHLAIVPVDSQLVGELGTVEVVVSAEGTVQIDERATDFPLAVVSLHANLRGSGFFTRSDLRVTSEDSPSSSFNEVIQRPMSFRFGDPFLFQGHHSTFAIADQMRSASATLQTRWRFGVVRDATGREVPYRLCSRSGIDWSAR